MCYKVLRTLHKLSVVILVMPIPVTARSKACLRSLACWDYGFEYRRGAWISVCCECCVLLGRGLRDGSITRPDESYQVVRVCVCVIAKTRREGLKNVLVRNKKLPYTWMTPIDIKMQVPCMEWNRKWDYNNFMTRLSLSWCVRILTFQRRSTDRFS